MLNRSYRLQPSALVGASLTLLLTILFLLLSPDALANRRMTSLNGPTLQVNAGFNTRFRDGNWIPFQISLTNNGADFSGSLSISAPSPYAGSGPPGTYSSTALYRQPISLANGAQKQVTMYVPLNTGGQGGSTSIRTQLLDSNGNAVRTQTSTVSALGQNDIFVGILSDQIAGFGPLNGVSLPTPGGSVVVETLNATSMPDKAAVLKNFDLLVLDNFTTNTLSNDRLLALETWVNQGGALIEVGGPEWHRTISALPASLLPVIVNGTSMLPAGTHLLPIGGPTKGGPGQNGVSDTISAPITASTASIVQGNTGQNSITQSTSVLASGTIPLIVQARQGQGIVCYLAFDPTLEPIVGWPGASNVWKSLVVRTLGDHLLSSNYNYSATTATGFQGVLSNTLPSPLLLLVLLLGYLIVLGPLRYFFVRWRKRRYWNWRIVLSSIVVFSLLTYGLALQQKGTAISSSSVSIIQLNQGGSTAHISTFVGVIVPNQGDYQVQIPGNDLVQTLSDQFNQGSSLDSGQQTTITAGQNSINVEMQGVASWTTRSLLSERDKQVHGAILSHLTLQNGKLTGTVTNTLSYALNDVYVLMPNGFAHLGNMSAGQFSQVNLAINAATNTSNISLADQLAQSYGLPTPYGSYVSGGPTPQNEVQRHLAILSTLSGAGGYPYPNCGGGGPCAVSQAYSAKLGRVYFSGGGPVPVGTNGSDPLLISGAAATFIGWADHPADITRAVTINGANTTNIQEYLVQAPLNVNLSGQLNLPANFISGQLVDIEGSNTQNQYNSVYTMTTGSMTFEFALPVNTHIQANSLTISEPSNLSQNGGPPIGSNSGPTADANRLRAYLYNWQTSSWDPFTLKQYSFSTPGAQAYIGPGGRILLQLANQDSTIGTIIFGKPSLTLQGNAS